MASAARRQIIADQQKSEAAPTNWRRRCCAAGSRLYSDRRRDGQKPPRTKPSRQETRTKPPVKNLRKAHWNNTKVPVADVRKVLYRVYLSLSAGARIFYQTPPSADVPSLPPSLSSSLCCLYLDGALVWFAIGFSQRCTGFKTDPGNFQRPSPGKIIKKLRNHLFPRKK